MYSSRRSADACRQFVTYRSERDEYHTRDRTNAGLLRDSRYARQGTPPVTTTAPATGEGTSPQRLRTVLTAVGIALPMVAASRVRRPVTGGSARLVRARPMRAGTAPRSTEPLRVASPAGCGDG